MKSIDAENFSKEIGNPKSQPHSEDEGQMTSRSNAKDELILKQPILSKARLSIGDQNNTNLELINNHSKQSDYDNPIQGDLTYTKD